MKHRPRICASVTGNDPSAIREVTPDVDLFEVRIDLIGGGWREVPKQLQKPWIACNRCTDEGGRWTGTETARIEELLSSLDLGAEIIDIEMGTQNLTDIVKTIKSAGKKCLLSFHSLVGTPAMETLRDIAESQLDAGADICKVVTTAKTFADNLTVVQLNEEYRDRGIVSFAMGDLGLVSRIFCPLAGGQFTYASLSEGRESAPGQITVAALRRLYGLL